MQDLTLQPQSHDSSKPGPIPWLIGLVALAGTFFYLKQHLHTIHQDVNSGVRNLMATSKTGELKVGIDGRDVSLKGTISSGTDRDWFVKSVEALPQVRIVNDEMTEHDPRKQARLDRIKFQQSISAIDTSVISFEANSAEFASGSRQALEQIVQLLNSYPDRRIKVAGHTDSSGQREKNLQLSRARAEAVTGYLLDRGVNRNQLIAQGYGSTQPMVSNDTEAGRARNRRIEIIVMN